ncbi:OadG family protein [bacterium]|nr:OadG family protein [bacterium]
MTDLMAQNLNTGLTITFIGMAVVLAFLTLMIFVMNITSGLIINVLNKYFPEEVKEEKAKVKKKPTSNDEEIAISIALAHHAQMGGK